VTCTECVTSTCVEDLATLTRNCTYTVSDGSTVSKTVDADFVTHTSESCTIGTDLSIECTITECAALIDVNGVRTPPNINCRAVKCGVLSILGVVFIKCCEYTDNTFTTQITCADAIVFEKVLRRTLQTAVISNGLATIASNFATGQNLLGRIDGQINFGSGNGGSSVTHFLKDNVTIILAINIVIDRTRVVSSALATATIIDEKVYTATTDFSNVVSSQVPGIQTPCVEFVNPSNNLTDAKRCTVFTRVCADVATTANNNVQKPDHIKTSYECYHPFDVSVIGKGYYHEICLLILNNGLAGTTFSVDQVNMVVNINVNSNTVGVISLANNSYVRAGDTTNLLVSVQIRTVETVTNGIRICFVHLVSDLTTNTAVLYDPTGGPNPYLSSSSETVGTSSADQKLSWLELF